MQAEKDAEEARLKRAEEAKKVKIVQDTSLPEPKRIKLRDCTANRGVRVVVYGWVHRRPRSLPWRRRPGQAPRTGQPVAVLAGLVVQALHRRRPTVPCLQQQQRPV